MGMGLGHCSLLDLSSLFCIGCPAPLEPKRRRASLCSIGIALLLSNYCADGDGIPSSPKGCAAQLTTASKQFTTVEPCGSAAVGRSDRIGIITAMFAASGSNRA